MHYIDKVVDNLSDALGYIIESGIKHGPYCIRFCKNSMNADSVVKMYEDEIESLSQKQDIGMMEQLKQELDVYQNAGPGITWVTIPSVERISKNGGLKCWA